MRILTVIMGVSLLAGYSPAQEVFIRDDGLYSSPEIKLQKQTNDTRKLHIRSAANLGGKLTIVATEADVVEVTYTKLAKTDSYSKAFDYIDLMSVSLSVLPEVILVKLRAPNPVPWNRDIESGSVEARLTVPYNCEVEVEAPYFDVTATGPFRSVLIPSSLGRIEVAHVTEKVDVSTANRKVILEDISGEIDAFTSNSSLSVRDAYAKDKQARFRNDGGDIRIEGFEGSLNIKNSYGRITILDFEPQGESNSIRGSSGPINIEISHMSEGQLIVANNHEDIDITIPDTLSAFFSLRVDEDEDGLIEAKDFPFRTDMVEHNRLYLLSGDGRVDISGSIRGSGNIYIRGVRED